MLNTRYYISYFDFRNTNNNYKHGLLRHICFYMLFFFYFFDLD